ncbi:unnamed protein product, partial [Dicrocoelium dendriticum]
MYLSNRFLKHSSVWALTTHSGRLFHSFITRVDNVISDRIWFLRGSKSFKLWPRDEQSVLNWKNCSTFPKSFLKMRL